MTSPADQLNQRTIAEFRASHGRVGGNFAGAPLLLLRNGAMEQMFPATFPSGQGSDFAGRVVEVGPGVTEFAPGDEVLAGPTAGQHRPTTSSPTRST